MAKTSITEQEREFIINAIQRGEALPLDFREKLFPTIQKEYELTYAGKMRKQDILRGEDGVMPVPLQVEKVFNGEREIFEDGWKNLIVFGDNLQFLKTCYQNEDELIKNKVKGKVKLIYIDPPFGTGDEYEGNKGQKGYTAKRKSADFVEFIRRRLVVAREILADDGVIVVRQAFNFGHYIKVILDETFGKDYFLNEVVIGRKREGAGSRSKLDVTNEMLYFFTKTDSFNINDVFFKRPLTDIKWTSFLMAEERNPKERVFLGIKLFPPKGQHFSLVQEKCDKLIQENFLRIRCKACATKYYYAEDNEDLERRIKKKTDKFKFYDLTSDDNYFGVKSLKKCFSCNNNEFVVDYLGSDNIKVNNNWLDIRSYSSTTGYPTENSEELLQRLLLLTTNTGDLVLDFFGGSGTTAAVAEKLGRKWIVCDIGKLSFYTIQKRILTIQDSKSLENPTKKYGKQAKSFVTANVGYYDLNKLFELGKDKYTKFVLGLFEIEVYAKPQKMKNYAISGERNGSYCFVWNFWDLKDKANLDIDFLEQLHTDIGGQIGSRFYIIAPANAVDFISDYHEIDQTRYYFLKVPYQVIQELHKEQFKKIRQPQSKNKINEVEDTVGFHFMRQPEAQSKFENGILRLLEFRSTFAEEGTNREMENFESLSMIIVDDSFNGKEFTMSAYYFAEDLLKNKTKKKATKDEENEESAIAEDLKHQTELQIPIPNFGERIAVKYIDIYGNEFTEEFKTN